MWQRAALDVVAGACEYFDIGGAEPEDLQGGGEGLELGLELDESSLAVIDEFLGNLRVRAEKEKFAIDVWLEGQHAAVPSEEAAVQCGGAELELRLPVTPRFARAAMRLWTTLTSSVRC